MYLFYEAGELKPLPNGWNIFNFVNGQITSVEVRTKMDPHDTKVNVEQQWKDIDRRKRRTRRNAWSSGAVFITNPTQT